MPCWTGRAARTPIVEDDEGHEIRYSGAPQPAIAALDPHRTFHIGSFDTYLSSTFQIGYLITPPHLADRVAELRYILDYHPPMPMQPVLEAFIREGHLASYARRMRQIYKGRRDLMISAFERHLAGKLNLAPIEAGLSAVALIDPSLADHISARSLADRAGQEGIVLTRLAHFYADQSEAPEGYLLGFGATDEQQIEQAARTLSSLMSDMLETPAIAVG